MKLKVDKKATPAASLALIGLEGHLPEISKSNKYLRSIFKCFARSSESDLEEDESYVEPSLIKSFEEDVEFVESQGFKIDAIQQCDLSPVTEFVTICDHPRIVYYPSVASERKPVLASASSSPDETTYDLFDGTFEKVSVSVKRVSKQMNNACAALNEANMLSKLVNKEFVLRYLCSIEDPQYIYLITDNYQFSLEDHVKGISNRPQLSTKMIFSQLTSAVDFLHSKNILMLNLNPQNVRVVTDDEVSKIKLANFDSAVEMKSESAVAITNYRGAKGFVAPEIKWKNRADLRTDIYALGCLFYYVDTNGGQLPQPYRPEQAHVQIAKVNKRIQTQKTSDGVLSGNMVKKMLQLKTNKRPSTDVIMKDPYFWDTQKIFNLVLEIAKKLEDVTTHKIFKAKLEVNQEQVIGENWMDKIEAPVITELVKWRPYNGKSLFELLRVIRNQFCHRRTPILALFMGTSNEELKDYWIGKFPQLIPHLDRVMKSLA